MKLIAIILLFPFMSYGQGTYKWTVQPSEYTIPAIDSIGRAVCFSANLGLTGNSGSGSSGVPLAISGTGTTFVFCNNTLHAATFIDASGNVWVTGNSTDGEMGLPGGASAGNLVKILVDSRGLPFTNITITQGSYIQITTNDIAGQYFVKHGTLSDSVFYAGVNQYGMGGNNDLGPTSCLTPTLMFGLPSGQRIIQMFSAFVTGMLLNNGQVWTWGGAGLTTYLGRAVSGNNYAVPIQVTGFDDSIRQIVGGSQCGWMALSKNDSLWGVTPNAGYLGNAGNPSYSSPHNLGDSIKRYIENGTTRTKILQIASNSNSFHILANDSTLWGWGDTGMGAIGTGVEANLAAPGGSSTPWFIDPSAVLVLAQTHPIQVTKKHNFIYVPSGCLFAFGTFALDANGQLFACGRNKGGVIPNGVIECAGDGGDLTSFYPNSWDVPYLTPVNPYGVTSSIQQTCEGCHTGAVTANCHSCGTTTSATANAGSNQTITTSTTTLNGSASFSTTGKIVYYVWTQTSGAASTIDVPASITPNISGLTTGTYVYQLAVQDQGFNTNTSTVTVTVGSATQTGFYFSAAGSGTACTIGSPCAPSYFNTAYATFVGGDTAYLNRGDVFPIQMICNVSGSSGNPIVVTAYGSGSLPIIGGMTTLSGWTNVSGNVWSVPYTGIYPNLLTVNGNLASESRTPNQSTGYFIPTAMGTTTITDAANASKAPVGDSIVARTSAFTTDKRKVTVNSGGVVTVGTAFTYSGVGGNGWFVYGNLPDSGTEWRDTNSTVQVFHAGTPTDVYQVPTVDTALLSEGTNQTFDHLHFKGASSANIILAFQAISNDVFSNDTMSYGIDGMQFRSEGAVTVTNCHFFHMMDDGVLKQNANNYNNSFLHDTLFDIGMIAGMGTSGNQSYFYTGITAGDSGSVVKFCQIDSTGYHGVTNFGNSFVVDSNAIVNVCQNLEDGGFVYTWVSSLTSFRQREIKGNVCHNSGGPMSHNGVNLTFASAACGIYLDNFSSNVLVQGNTVYNGNSVGFFDHGPSNTFLNNTSYGWGFSDIFVAESAGSAVITGLIVKHNIFGSGTASIPAVRFSTANNDLSTFGTVDSNQVAGALLTINPYWTFSTGASDPGTFRTPASWFSNTGYDQHSTFQVGTPSLLFNQSSTSAVKSLLGGFIDLNGNKYSGSVTLQPYSSLYLFNFSIGIPIPRGNRIIVL